MTGTADVIVIGAGVIGTAVAFELSKAGYRTLSVDRNGAAGHGSTSASCAIVRVHYSTLAGTALAFEGYHYWRDWANYLQVDDELGLAQFRETGCLVMKIAGNNYMTRHTAICDQLGVPYSHWDADEIRRHLPHFRLDQFAPAKRPDDAGFAEPTGPELDGGVFFPTAGYVSDPALAAHNLQRAAEQHGARFAFNREITGVLQHAGHAAGVRFADGSDAHAPIVINVAGPASSRINHLAGVEADMAITSRALRQEVVHLPAPEGYFADAGGLVVSDGDIAVYSRPEQGGHLLIGSEDPPCDEHVFVADDSKFDRAFSDQWQVQAMRQAQRAPSLGIPSRMRGVVDLYDVTEDWIPVYDKSALAGFYMACGSSGNQFKNAAVAGKLMAALVTYCEAGNDHDQSPLRFDLDYTGGEIDTRCFSRRRKVNANSSFSVLG